MNQTYMHELLFIMNMVDGQHKVTGAHFKNLTRIDLGDGEVFEKMGPVTGVDLSKPGELEAALGPLNAAFVSEINQLKQHLNEAIDAGQAVASGAADLERALDEAQEREQALQQAAEAAEQDRQVLLDTLAERSRQIEALQAQLAGQAQAASVG